MISATIVIPFHNEKKNLEILSNELINALKNKPKDIEVSVIFVNDNSNDGGNIYISKFINELENFRIINLEKRSGQTGAFKEAFSQCKTDYIIRMDSDLQDNPKDLSLFFNKIILLQPDLIMGIREVRKHKRILRLASIMGYTHCLTMTTVPFRTLSHSFGNEYLNFASSEMQFLLSINILYISRSSLKSFRRSSHKSLIAKMLLF